MSEITNERRWGITGSTVLSRARLDRLRALGLPVDAIRDDGTLDLDAAARAGFRVVDGVLYAPGDSGESARSAV